MDTATEMKAIRAEMTLNFTAVHDEPSAAITTNDSGLFL